MRTINHSRRYLVASLVVVGAFGCDEGPVTARDASTPDTGTCVPESDVELCESRSLQCGPASALDACGQMRAFDCGSCVGGSCNGAGRCIVPETCGGACTALTYDACTCGASDPCGWSEDGACDAYCAETFGTVFDDSEDCETGAGEVQLIGRIYGSDMGIGTSQTLHHPSLMPTSDGGVALQFSLDTDVIVSAGGEEVPLARVVAGDCVGVVSMGDDGVDWVDAFSFVGTGLVIRPSSDGAPRFHHRSVHQYAADGVRSATAFDDAAIADTNDMAFGADGRAVFGGLVYDVLIFGAGESTEATVTNDSASGLFGTGFVARYSPSGGFEWVTKIGGPSSRYVYIARVDFLPGGDVIVAGAFSGTTTFSGGDEEITVATDASGQGGFIARLDRAGAPVWIRVLGGEGSDAVRDVVIHPEGAALVLVGNFDGTMVLGEGEAHETTLTGTGDQYVARYSVDGSLDWARQTVSGGAMSGGGYERVTLGTDGAVYISGAFVRDVVFDAGGPEETTLALETVAIGGTPRTASYIARYESNGAFTWVSAVRGAVVAVIPDIAVMSDGSLAVEVVASGDLEVAWGGRPPFVASALADSYEIVLLRLSE
jgi:hypothetical protein